jgi:hypothetical protein
MKNERGKMKNTLRLSGFAFEKRKWIYDLSENNLRKKYYCANYQKNQKNPSPLLFLR